MLLKSLKLLNSPRFSTTAVMIGAEPTRSEYRDVSRSAVRPEARQGPGTKVR